MIPFFVFYWIGSALTTVCLIGMAYTPLRRTDHARRISRALVSFILVALQLGLLPSILWGEHDWLQRVQQQTTDIETLANANLRRLIALAQFEVGVALRVSETEALEAVRDEAWMKSLAETEHCAPHEALKLRRWRRAMFDLLSILNYDAELFRLAGITNGLREAVELRQRWLNDTVLATLNKLPPTTASDLRVELAEPAEVQVGPRSNRYVVSYGQLPVLRAELYKVTLMLADVAANHNPPSIVAFDR